MPTRLTAMALLALLGSAGTTALGAAQGPGPAGPPGSKLKALSPGQVAGAKVLSQYLKALDGKRDPAVVYKVRGPVSEISSAALGAQFPGWRFYVVPYELAKNPRYKGRVAIPGGLYNVLGVSEAGAQAEIPGGSHEEAGKFLASQKVALRDAGDAHRVWTAVCHLLRQGSTDAPSRAAGPNLWHLGVEPSGDREYYFEVRTAEDGSISAGRFQTRPAEMGKG